MMSSGNGVVATAVARDETAAKRAIVAVRDVAYRFSKGILEIRRF
jgi:hypothetical protein